MSEMKQTTQEKWEDLVRAQMKLTKTRAEAVRAVAKRYPRLRAEVVAEANAKPAQQKDGAAPGRAIATWDKLVAHRVAAGEKRAAVIRDLVKQFPALHAQYLREYTQANSTR